MSNKRQLIDANEYPCRGCGAAYCYQNCSKFKKWLENTVDAVEVVHGRWILADDGDGDVCSVCGTDFCNIIYETGNWNYCPNCGTDMRGNNNGK